LTALSASPGSGDRQDIREKRRYKKKKGELKATNFMPDIRFWQLLSTPNHKTNKKKKKQPATNNHLGVLGT